MLISLLNYIKGYLHIRVQGSMAERLLNICHKKGIILWDIKLGCDCHMFCMYRSDFYKLRGINRKTRCHIKIVNKNGMPFFIHRYRKRGALAMAAVLFCAILYTLSLYIWDIEIAGNSMYTDATILNYLKDNSIMHGISKSDIDCEEIEFMLRSSYEDIIWTSVSIDGTRLIVDIRENIDLNEIEKLGYPCDIRASDSGTITDIIVRTGTKVADRGMSINQDDMLVSGTLEYEMNDGNISYKYVSADADVYIDTDIPFKCEVPYEYVNKVKTGRQKKRYMITLFEKNMKIYISSHNYKKYDTIVERKQLKILRNMYLPLYISECIIEEYEETTCVYTKDEAKSIVTQKLKYFLKSLEENEMKILSTDIELVEENNILKASGYIHVNKKTGKISEIEKQEERTEVVDEYN